MWHKKEQFERLLFFCPDTPQWYWHSLQTSLWKREAMIIRGKIFFIFIFITAWYSLDYRERLIAVDGSIIVILFIPKKSCMMGENTGNSNVRIPPHKNICLEKSCMVGENTGNSKLNDNNVINNFAFIVGYFLISICVFFGLLIISKLSLPEVTFLAWRTSSISLRVALRNPT